MVFQIPKSKVGPGFDAAIAAYLDEVEGWRQHMESVARDPVTYQPYPAPVAPPLIAQALRQDRDGDGRVTFVPDYEVVDDAPTPDQTLRVKKDRLLMLVSQMEIQAAAAVVPPAKRRYLSILANDAVGKDAQLRTETDTSALTMQTDATDRFAAIDRHGAKLMYDIEDLTEETIDSWAPEEFPT
jgi:hypothetical protein